MRARIVVGGVLSSAAILVIGWQLGGQPATTAGIGGAASSGTSGTTGTSGTSGSGGTASGTGTTAPGSSAGSGTSGSGGAGDGTFDGTTEQTQYGPMQVAIVVSGGKITDVKALQLTDRGGRSAEISASAAPVLRQEAISAQSAKIQAVSGATYTSDGYIASLQSAIDRAGL
jgi:uncharacterized protein with FMN-binding domain